MRALRSASAPDRVDLLVGDGLHGLGSLQALYWPSLTWGYTADSKVMETDLSSAKFTSVMVGTAHDLHALVGGGHLVSG
jgi:hypothetical protein